MAKSENPQSAEGESVPPKKPWVVPSFQRINSEDAETGILLGPESILILS